MKSKKSFEKVFLFFGVTLSAFILPITYWIEAQPSKYQISKYFIIQNMFYGMNE